MNRTPAPLQSHGTVAGQARRRGRAKARPYKLPSQPDIAWSATMRAFAISRLHPYSKVPA
jgi:hypothetical protein